MLENIANAVQQQLENQQVPVPTTEPISEGQPIPEVPGFPSELQLAKEEIGRLNAAAEATAQQHAADIAAIKTKGIIDNALKPVATVSTSQQEMAIAEVIRRIKNARWHALPPHERCEAIGIYGSEQVSDKALHKLFGPDTSAAATQLQKSNPAEYLRQRGIARCRGIL